MFRFEKIAIPVLFNVWYRLKQKFSHRWYLLMLILTWSVCSICRVIFVKIIVHVLKLDLSLNIFSIENEENRL